MQIAMIGLGRMGHNMVKRLINCGHQLIVYDQDQQARRSLSEFGAIEATSIKDLSRLLSRPRIIWIMVPHQFVDEVITELRNICENEDIIIDGGNSHFLASVNHNIQLKKSGLRFVDVGVSGGVFGLDRGYCLMIGSDQKTFDTLEPIFKSLAPGEQTASKTPGRKDIGTAHQGYFRCGDPGAGHYVKMIHNAIEYGMMQSYAEGLDLLKNANLKHLPSHESFDFDIKEICELWRRGSVINSWLLDLLTNALHKDGELANFHGHVPDSGEGRFALMEAIKQGTPTPNLASALFTRFRSQKKLSFAEQSLSAMRNEFGGHQEQRAKP